MVKSIYKNFLLAAVSSLITMFFIEISMSVFVGKNPSYYSARLCYDSDFDYYYCPDKIYKNKLSEYDGSEIIFDYTNFQGIPISKDKNKEKNYLLTSDVFIIGDSFIQADEIHYNQRMASYLRKENINAIEIGMASWNSKQYKKVVKKISQIMDKHFFIFVMANDVAPNYTRSAINNEMPYIYENDGSFRSNIRELLRQIKKQSWIVYSINEARFFFDKSEIHSKSDKRFTFNHFDQYFECGENIKKNEKFNLDGFYDYIVYSQEYQCWPKIHKLAANEVLKDLIEIKQYIQTNGGYITFYLIPSGSSFIGEHTVNRNAPKNKSVHPKYLVKYFQENLDSSFIDLYPFLMDLKKLYPDENSLYFPQDGHWKAITHQALSNLILETLN